MTATAHFLIVRFIVKDIFKSDKDSDIPKLEELASVSKAKCLTLFCLKVSYSNIRGWIMSLTPIDTESVQYAISA